MILIVWNIRRESYINGTVGAELIPYKRNLGQRYLLGKDYVILREAFKNLCGHREIREKIKTVLITFGGSDPLNLTPKNFGEVDELLC